MCGKKLYERKFIEDIVLFFCCKSHCNVKTLHLFQFTTDIVNDLCCSFRYDLNVFLYLSLLANIAIIWYFHLYIFQVFGINIYIFLLIIYI